MKTHIKGLSGKQYQTLYGLKSLDFVLMFIPIEPAFMMAVTHDNERGTGTFCSSALPPCSSLFELLRISGARSSRAGILRTS